MGRKWENIKRSKAKLDQQRGATFSRLTKDIMKAAREGGPDPETNYLLKAAVAAARKANMPNENIQRAIARGAGLDTSARYDEIVYEGYGPGGVAIMMNIVTDNRNRTAADVRHIFSKHGGSLGETGCVSWMFKKRGVIEIDRSAVQLGEDDLMVIALDAGAEDLVTEEDSYVIYTAPEGLNQVMKQLEAAGVPVEKGEVAMVPTTTVAVSGEQAEQLLRLLELLEEHDDVQNVYTNADISEA
ncbi:MAG: YebC/PmpR family DNA-binding transcriptional regulator [Bacillota bacterium]|uniref:Probable transcriptional regulatory protein A6D92_12785 n=1 Tax=Symbiobacterium thermophilum TaxID=2734 RepID=A0A1Y2T2Y3_SYMTR|nr:MAG: transcriptional regulator [Symbiobacterium thermophilum]PZN72929.1 MAG: YebC/PmpR family DNA-binding transcriptional regulator [Bacillota bacterium]